ncbi:MAG: 6-phosphofructokinase [Kiritimatiellaeota bacterium]|nr:6-phosphofructokinase [Kiritimatiellota bacterium]
MTGNMVIAQSGGPSMVINQSLVGAVLAARASGKVGKILGARHGVAGILKEDFVDMRKPSVAKLEGVAQTPSAALGSVRKKPTGEECAKIFAVLKKHGVRYFFYIGGNDSAETVHIIGEAARAEGNDLRCFHIPKTIDNDLRGNDHTPGFGSAARFVAMAFMGDNLDNRALGGVKINVVMGRHAGFLTAASALARVHPGDGPHLIYLPERPFDVAAFCDDVHGVMKKTGRCVVAVSEGIADKDGTPIAARLSTNVERDSHGNVQLSGTGALGDVLAQEIKQRLGISRVRADTFGYLQRSFPGIASVRDAAEARAVGKVAVQLALGAKHASGSVAICRAPGKAYRITYRHQPLKDVAKETRHMPDSYIAPSGHDVTAAFLRYAKPLIGNLPPVCIM